MNRKILPLDAIYSYLSGRTSVPASEKESVRGSVTVEAAMAVPIFFLAVVSLLYLMEMTAIQTSMRAGLQYAGKKAAEEAVAFMPSCLEKDVVDAIGPNRLDRSIVLGGSGGITCSGSRISARTGIGELVLSYKVRIPIPFFRIPQIERQEKMRIKVWNGYERAGFGAEDEETVYVTENGLVYHKDYHCTHLELSIHLVSRQDIEGLRNHGGGRYTPCEHCMKQGKGEVYITDTVDRYHSSLSCSGLKRTVYAVPLSEVIGKGACSRCGQ